MAIDYQRARRYLMRRDPVLATVIKQVGPCGLHDVPSQPPFMALAEAIASQQLSVKAADTIFGRFCGLFGPDNIPDPVRLSSLDDDVIRASGFSRSKGRGVAAVPLGRRVVSVAQPVAARYFSVAVNITRERISISPATTGVGTPASCTAMASRIIGMGGGG